MNYSTVHACRMCRSKNLHESFTLGHHRLNGFLKPGDPPRPVVPLTFLWCDDCACLQQKHSANPELLHNGQYWYRSGVSATMRQALADVVSSVGQRVSLQEGDVVVDIGGNDSTLLRLYGKHLTRVNVEPMAESFPEARQGVSLVIQNAWGDSTAVHAYNLATGGKKAKVVTALGMLYSVENPDVFVRDVASVLADDGVFVIQLMALPDMLAMQDIGNLCHEHLTFPTLPCLYQLFCRHGLKIVGSEYNRINGGSVRLYLQKGAPEREYRHSEGVNYPELIQSFVKNALANLNYATRAVYEELKTGHLVYVYGASTKGNTILQCMGLTREHLPMAADRDPKKHGLFMSAGDIPIVSEDDAILSADTFLVLPYAFRDEITARLKLFSWSGRLIFPLPVLEVVDV